MIKALLVGMLLLLASSAGLAAELLTEDDDGLLSGNLQSVALSEVTAFLEDNYRVKFVGAEDLLQTEVTISFAKLSLEKAIKRIFGKMNVVLKYDSKGTVTEVRLLPGSGSRARPGVAGNLMRPQPSPVVQPQPEPLPEDDAAVDDQQDYNQQDAGDQNVDEADASAPDDAADVDQDLPPPSGPAPPAAAGTAAAGQ